MTGVVKPTKFLSPEVLAAALRQVAQVAKEEGVRVALVGGYALQFYGSQRLTADLDLVAERALEGLPADRQLSFGGVGVTAKNGTVVDLIVRDDDYAKLYEAALDHAAAHRKVATPIVLPEYLAAMKLASGRGKDELDLEFLILSVLDTAGRVRARKVVKKTMGAYAAQEFDRVVEETEWKASKGRV